MFIFGNKLKKNRFKFLKKPLKIIFIIPLIIFTFVMFATVLSETTTDRVASKLGMTFYKPVEGKQGLRPNNPDGSVNGLNLLLIDDIKTEGYVKEILSLYRDSAEKKLDSYEYQVPLEYKIGVQADETGPYNGTLLPKSYLPTKNGVVVWKESFDGVPAENMTVKDLPPDNALAFVKSYQDVYGWMSVNARANYGFQGLYQNELGSEVNGYPPSTLTWKGSSTGRGARTFYQPDGMSYLNGRMTAFINGYFNDEEINKLKSNPNIANMCIGPIHNAGEGGFLSPLVYGSHWTVVGRYDPPSSYMAIENLYNDLNNSIEKYPALKGSYFGHGSRFAAAYLLCEAGWNFSGDGLQFLEGSAGGSDELASILLGPGKTMSDLMDYFNKKKANLPISDSEAQNLYGWDSASQPWIYYPAEGQDYKGFMFKYDPTKTVTRKDGTKTPFLSVMNSESLGQMYSTMFQGSYLYAVALKYAGVNVDPTNPATYFDDKLKPGEFKPSGGIKDAIAKAGFTLSLDGISQNRIKLLDEAATHVGSPYAFGADGRVYTGSADDAAYIQYLTGRYGGANYYHHINSTHVGKRLFDCSRFVQYVYETAIGKQIQRGSSDQLYKSGGKNISLSDAKPGDLGGDGGHIVMYIGKVPGGILVIDQASEPVGLTVRIDNAVNSYDWVTFSEAD